MESEVMGVNQLEKPRRLVVPVEVPQEAADADRGDPRVLTEAAGR